jgi:hypothetical protein
MALGMIADYHFGTASAVAETGELIWASATATRYDTRDHLYYVSVIS